MDNSLLTGLNKDQKKAVEVIQGPLLILAGAGSGKTRCLTYRTGHLMKNGVHGDKILAVTFTNKAANEMKERIEKLIQEQGEGMVTDFFGGASMPTIGTFHSICVRILRKHIEHLKSAGISKQFVIFSTNDMLSLIKSILKEYDNENNDIKPKPILSHISSAKSKLLSPDAYAEETEDNRFTQAVKKIYPIYQRKLREHNALDFDDLLQKTAELLEDCPEVLKYYREKWNHLMVDEYQDTNFAQYRIVRLLGDEHQNICVIGDDHQSIYSFRGADYTNILNFEKDFPTANVVKLEQNYRSSKCILNNANTLIAHNKSGRPKNLWTENESGEKLKIVELSDEKDEGNFIAKQIQELRVEGKAEYSDCTILYRMNAQSRAIEEALMRNQIPYKIIGGTRFFDRKEIRDIIAYLRLIFNYKDDVSFARIINVPTRKIGVSTLETLKKYSNEYRISLFEILESVEDIPELSVTKKAALIGFRNIIKGLQKYAENNPITNIIDEIIKKIDYEKFLDDGTGEGKARMENVRELLSVANKYDHTDDSLASFLEGVSLIADVDNYQENDNSVTLMTVHSSKGLEFPVVFLPGWEEGIFPSSSSQTDLAQMEEERRLGYVAITRAREICIITHAQRRMLFGKTNYSKGSCFLDELDQNSIDRESMRSSFSYKSSTTRPSTPQKKYNEDELIHNFPETREEALWGIKKEQSSEWKTGMIIKHAEWGDGTIILVSGDVLTIAFKGKGVKKVVGSIAPIEVVE